jgi:hypothetical protein
MKAHCIAFLLLLLVAGAFASKNVLVQSKCAFKSTRTRAELDAYEKSWHNCEYNGVRLNRTGIIDYFSLGFDINHDGVLSMEECEFARNCFFSAAERQFGETCKTVFDRCDCDQDGVITQEDFLMSHFTCLKDCEAGIRIYKYIGQYLQPGSTAFAKCRGDNDEFV